MTDVSGAIPATRTAIDLTEQFAEAGPERRYGEQVQSGPGRSRTRSPAHTAIGAREDVDKDLAHHRYYPPTGP
ncbi:hypothetical protein GCM10022403_027810 [Streptomyces coacervatus]|uniref:Uncharacterized protein n=1 Tax=Streptomyces coacervatus TaxID=647381 RepID=A0ABP7HHX8_9ACTN|nr:hypothetical protein [Streptomyces coacervatus]MDF2265484.1 hypothetical protein [Streptomyces coacervatus]